MLSSSFNAIVPIMCVVAAAIAALLAEALRRPGERLPIAGLGVIGLVAAGFSAYWLWGRGTTSFGVVSADNFGLFIVMVLVVIGIMTMAFSSQVVARDNLPGGEYYGITLLGIAGMMLMATASDLLVIFLALEVLSLSVYVLTAIRRDSAQAAEGAFKYFLLGGFSSAVFLYGIAFTFGIAGSTRLDRVGAVLAAQAMGDNQLALVAMGLLLVGFAFKVSAVPFHMWTPDAYQGAPTIVTAFMSTAVKAAAFGAFARVFLSAFEPLRHDWTPVLWAIAAATMITGTVIGVRQTNMKRLLAYSSIAHAGYILLGIVAGNDIGKAAILFYLLAYGVTNLAAFATLALLGTREHANDNVVDVAGLANSHPAAATLMTVFLLSRGGMPPTAGFVAKWYVFTAAVNAGYYWLAIIGVLTSVVSIFFYLRIVVSMWMAEPAAGARPLPMLSRFGMVMLGLSVVAVFYLGILPTRFLTIAAASIGTIF
ncbi:MAG: NADH-quinone oxidoreductase subunit N [Bacteroidales bacterium]